MSDRPPHVFFLNRLYNQALLEVVDSGSKNMEIAVMRAGQEMTLVDSTVLDAIVAEVQAEIEEAKNSSGRAESKSSA